MREPVGVILAGGRGRRLGGAKATAPLGGGTLLDRPLAALRDALGPGAVVAIVAKADTPLPKGRDAVVWREPASPSHPLVGLVCALERAAGRPVLTCPVDLPFVSSSTLAQFVAADPGGRVASLACGAQSGLQPLLGRWDPSVLPELRGALAETPLPAMRALAVRLGAREVPVPEAELENVNTPAELTAAQGRLSRR